MAFNVNNRLPSPTTVEDEDDGIDTLPWEDTGESPGSVIDGGSGTQTGSGTGEETDSESEESLPMPVPPELADQTLLQSNTVATQSWVFKIFMYIWGWTKFFATKSLQVVNDIRASFIKAGEIQADRTYTQKLMLIDNKGKAAELFIVNGELQINYPFERVFIYPGSQNSGLKIREFYYRNPDIAKNFIGLNPYVILTNFVDISDIDYEIWQDRRCPFFCVADGEDKVVDRTLLISCPQTHKITRIKVIDENNREILHMFEVPRGSVFRHVTINMPSFKPVGEGVNPDAEPSRVPLPEDGPNVPYSQIQPFMPPFILPPPPPCPFLHNGNAPQIPPGMPPELQQNIFEEDYLKDDNLFQDFVGNVDSGSTIPQKTYEVVYEEYATNIYYNIPIKRSELDENVKQFLVVETVEI